VRVWRDVHLRDAAAYAILQVQPLRLDVEFWEERMSEYTITRRQSLGILAGLAAVPFIGRPFRGAPQDTFEMSFHSRDEPVIVYGYPDGRADVHWKEPWIVAVPNQLGWRIALGPHGSQLRFRYTPSMNQLEVDFVRLMQPLVT
jgi:hypothetical protein